MQDVRFNPEESKKLREFVSSLDFGNLDYTENITSLMDDYRERIMPFTYITVTFIDPTQSPNNRMKIAMSGVKDHLGYNEIDFTFNKSLSIIQGIYRIATIEYGKATYKLLENPMIRKRISANTFYTIPYVVKHERGHLLSIMRHSFFRKINETMSYAQINICHVSKIIEKGLLKPIPLIRHHRMDGFFSKETKLIMDTAVPEILIKIKKEFGVKSILTQKQFEIASLLCQGFSTKEIAEELNMSKHNISKHNRGVLETINSWFPREFDFKNAKEVAVYLQEIGFLQYMKLGN